MGNASSVFREMNLEDQEAFTLLLLRTPDLEKLLPDNQISLTEKNMKNQLVRERIAEQLPSYVRQFNEHTDLIGNLITSLGLDRAATKFIVDGNVNTRLADQEVRTQVEKMSKEIEQRYQNVLQTGTPDEKITASAELSVHNSLATTANINYETRMRADLNNQVMYKLEDVAKFAGVDIELAKTSPQAWNRALLEALANRLEPHIEKAMTQDELVQKQGIDALRSIEAVKTTADDQPDRIRNKASSLKSAILYYLKQ